MESLLNELLIALTAAWAKSAWLGLIGTLCLFGLRIWRLAEIQTHLPPNLQWANYKPWAKWMLPFVLSAVGTGVLAYAGGGLTMSAVLVGAISAGLSAAGAHHGTKALGSAIRAPKAYEPGLSRAVDLVVPPPTLKP